MQQKKKLNGCVHLREEFWEKIRDIRVEDLIFIDEAGALTHSARW